MAKPLFDFNFNRRAMLDTNMAMNAAFLPSGLARLAVDFLRRSGTPLYVSEHSLSEAAIVSSRYARAAGAAMVARKVLGDFLRDVGILFAPRSADLITGVNRADAPIAAAARAADAILLTDDIELITQCRAAGIAATQPWEVARSYRGENQLPALLTIARYLEPTPRGYLFVRVIPGQWAPLKLDQFFTVAACGDTLFLGYSGARHEWLFHVAGLVIALPMELQADAHYVVRGQYVQNGVNIRLDLAAAVVGQPAEQRSSFERGYPPTLHGARLTLGHSSRGDAHWNGFLKDIVVADGSVSGRTFRGLAKTEDLSPNPLDQDRLKTAFDLLNLIEV